MMGGVGPHSLPLQVEVETFQVPLILLPHARGRLMDAQPYFQHLPSTSLFLMAKEKKEGRCHGLTSPTTWRLEYI